MSSDTIRVLVACEFSGVVREAFNAYSGFHAMSCDLLPPEDGRTDYHFQGPVELCLPWGWDVLIAFPPCTHLSSSGARWWPAKRADGRQRAAINFFTKLADARIEHVAVENPIGILSTVYAKPTQIIQPWQHGHGETKATCLWLRNLPPLVPSKVVPGRVARVHGIGPGPNRWRERSRTLPGIAAAMAAQWVPYIVAQRKLRGL